VVKSDVDTINRFNGFCSSFAEKTVETVNVFFQSLATRLKPGVNDKSFASGSLVCDFARTQSGDLTLNARIQQSDYDRSVRQEKVGKLRRDRFLIHTRFQPGGVATVIDS
jgi:hypothetical protein